MWFVVGFWTCNELWEEIELCFQTLELWSLLADEMKEWVTKKSVLVLSVKKRCSKIVVGKAGNKSLSFDV